MSLATATAVPMVPQVPWEWTFGSGLCGSADAGGDFVAGDEGFGQLGAAAGEVFRYGEGPGEDVDGGMAAAESGAFVHFQGDAGGGVGEGGHGRLGFEGVTEDGGCATVAAGGEAGEVGVLR